MVGDRRHDIEAGHACGIATAGVTWGVGDLAELEGVHPTAIVNQPAELCELLMSHHRRADRCED